MNKAEMADRLAARTGLSKAVAKEAVDRVFAVIGDALADGEEVRIAGFGAFGTRSRPARTGRNPSTGEEVSIAASTSPTFKAGKTLKDAVNAGSGS
ncbi:MAG: HU family DNA-binding protein [Bryobacterales bacterium]|nr:HU family DNA-binding protein [Bryobacterales bacterium]